MKLRELVFASQQSPKVDLGKSPSSHSSRTHAQNVLARRHANRVTDQWKGLPIDGALSPTEIAHRARRKQRRIKKTQKALADARENKQISLISDLESKLARLLEVAS